MANLFKVNFTPTSGAHLMYELKTLLLSAGWILKGNGDGTSFDQVADTGTTPVTTDYITSTAKAAINSSWWRVRMAGTAPQTEFVLQHNASGNHYQWSIRFSPSAGFVTGGSATVAPTSTDEVALCAAYTQILAADGSYRANLMADSASPYGFWLAAFPNGGGNPNAGFMLDPLTDTNSLDVHKYAVYLSQSNGAAYRTGLAGALDFSAGAGGNLPRGYLSATLTSGNFVGLMPQALAFSGANTTPFPGYAGPNAFDHKETLIAPAYVRKTALAAPRGYKGFSSLMRWASTTRSTGAALDQATARDWIMMGEVALPWDGSYPLV